MIYIIFRVLGWTGWSVIDPAIVVNSKGNGVITSTVLPSAAGAAITAMYTSFSLSSGFGASTNYPNAQNVCAWASPVRTGDYSGVAINTDGTAYVVSMKASDPCSASVATNWQSQITKLVL